jgi:hypothetical protein
VAKTTTTTTKRKEKKHLADFSNCLPKMSKTPWFCYDDVTLL